MNPEDYTKAKKVRRQSAGHEKLLSRREVLNKAGLYALSAATMMVLLKSQAAMAASGGEPASNTDKTIPAQWQRTTRS